MDLDEVRNRLEQLEGDLPSKVLVELEYFDRDGRALHVALTERFRRMARRAKIWKSRPMLTALKNAQYGFEPSRARSRGGSDGLFLLDRGFRPENEMMKKIFSGFLDKPASGAREIATALGVALGDLEGARLVSHQVRILGVLTKKDDEHWFVAVDFG